MLTFGDIGITKTFNRVIHVKTKFLAQKQQFLIQNSHFYPKQPFLVQKIVWFFANNPNCYHETNHKYTRPYHKWNKIRAQIKFMAANSRNLEQFIYKIHYRRFFLKLKFKNFEKTSFSSSRIFKKSLKLNRKRLNWGIFKKPWSKLFTKRTDQMRGAIAKRSIPLVIFLGAFENFSNTMLFVWRPVWSTNKTNSQARIANSIKPDPWPPFGPKTVRWSLIKWKKWQNCRPKKRKNFGWDQNLRRSKIRMIFLPVKIINPTPANLVGHQRIKMVVM